MTKYIGVGISVTTFLVCLLAGEVLLWSFAQVPDPYEQFKYSRPVNPFIRSEFPINYHAITDNTEGLPGVEAQNVFSTNNMGFRGDSIVVPKPKNEYRIFMIGGSTTECLILDDSAAITAILQKRLNKAVGSELSIKVYNAGKSGDASPDHISMLAHRIVHLEPDMVIVFSGVNDLTRSIHGYDYTHYIKRDIAKFPVPVLRFAATEFQLPRRLYYLLKPLTVSDQEILEAIEAKADSRGKTILVSDIRMKINLLRSKPISNKKPRLDVDSYAKNLTTLAGIAKGQDIRMVLMTQQTTWNSTIDPEARNWHWMLYRDVRYREELMHAAMEKLNDAIRDLAAEFKIPLYDLARSLPKSTEFFYDDMHFNTNGARVAGVELASLIIKEDLLAPEPVGKEDLETLQQLAPKDRDDL